MRKVLVIGSSTYYHGDGYKTRVLMELELLSKDFDVYLFLPEYHEYNIEDSDSRWVKNTIKYKTFYNSSFKYLLNYISFKKKLRYILKHDKYVVIAESLVPAFKSVRISRKTDTPFVYDCHGSEPNEYKMSHVGPIGNIIGNVLAFIEKYVIRKSNLLVTVSKKQLKLWRTNNSHVLLPMIPSEHFYTDALDNRVFVRRELGILDSEEVYVYSGQNQLWQMCDETIKIYKKIAGNREHTRLVIYTGMVEYFTKLCESNGIENAIVKKVKYLDMPKYLDACDYGFCIRSHSVVNQVASPTKVLEYLSRNVKPIISQYVGDYADDLYQKDLAVIWNGDTSFSKTITFDGVSYVNGLKESAYNTYINAIKLLLMEAKK